MKENLKDDLIIDISLTPLELAEMPERIEYQVLPTCVVDTLGNPLPNQGPCSPPNTVGYSF